MLHIGKWAKIHSMLFWADAYAKLLPFTILVWMRSCDHLKECTINGLLGWCRPSGVKLEQFAQGVCHSMAATKNMTDVDAAREIQDSNVIMLCYDIEFPCFWYYVHLEWIDHFAAEKCHGIQGNSRVMIRTKEFPLFWHYIQSEWIDHFVAWRWIALDRQLTMNGYS